MAFQAETNLSCPVCRGIFQDPVILPCSHSFCKACWQQCWSENQVHLCPVCRQRCGQSDPPRNLALKTVCEDFLAARAQRTSAGAESLCILHGETLRLFCLDDQHPVCVVCLHSEIHNNHCIRPIDEAARDYKSGLQCSLEDLREKLELFNDVKRNFDLTEQDIEVQATDTERQIKDVFSILRRCLQKEEENRIAALREEKQRQSQMLRGKIDALNTDITAFSSIITATEEALQAEDLSFLQNYQTTVERVYQHVSDVPEPISGALLDTNKHLNNLTSVVLDKIKLMAISNPEALRSSCTQQDTSHYYNTFSNAPRNRFSLALPTRNETSERMQLHCYDVCERFIRLNTADSTRNETPPVSVRNPGNSARGTQQQTTHGRPYLPYISSLQELLRR